MAEKVTVKYVGPRMAILAGRAIYHGEAREVTPSQLEHARKTHPNGFMVIGEEDQPEDQLEVFANPLEALTVADIKEAAAATDDVAYLQKLIELEQEGDARKTAIEALLARIAQLTPEPEDEAARAAAEDGDESPEEDVSE